MKVFNLLLGLRLMLVILLFGTLVQGQEKKARVGSKGVTFKENKASLNFDDELVEATTQKPDLFYLFQRKNFNYNRLIKLRENFIPEMRKTTEDVQRVRGGN